MNDDWKSGLRFISLAAEIERRRLIDEATAQAHPEYDMPVASGGWQIPASMLPPGDEEVERLRAEYRGEYVPPPDSYTRQQVKAMIRMALIDRTDEWLAKDIDERMEILLSMFTKEKP